MVNIYPSAIHMIIGEGIPSEFCRSMRQSAGSVGRQSIVMGITRILARAHRHLHNL
jgi:hypothetical protein